MKALLESPLKIRPNGLTLYFRSVAVFLAVVTALILEFSGGRLPVDKRFVAAVLFLNALLAMLLLLAHQAVQTWVTEQVVESRRKPWLFLFAVLLLHLAYALGTEFKPAHREPLASIVHWDKW